MRGAGLSLGNAANALSYGGCFGLIGIKIK
jgi:hypothetical protein